MQNAIFNNANFSSIATDEKGVIQLLDVGAERVVGYAAAEVTNKITPADISDPQEGIARVPAFGTVQSSRYVRKRTERAGYSAVYSAWAWQKTVTSFRSTPAKNGSRSSRSQTGGTASSASTEKHSVR